MSLEDGNASGPFIMRFDIKMDDNKNLTIMRLTGNCFRCHARRYRYKRSSGISVFCTNVSPATLGLILTGPIGV